MTKKCLRIRRESLFSFLFLIYSFTIHQPYILSLLSGTQALYGTINKCGFFLGLGVIIWYFITNPRIDAETLLIGVFTSWLLFADIINKGITSEISPSFFEMIRVLGFILAVKLAILKGKGSNAFLGLNVYLWSLIIANFASLLLFDNGIVYDRTLGWQPYYIMGNTNRFAFTFLFAFSVDLFFTNGWQHCSTIRKIILPIVCMLSSIIAGNSTSCIIVSAMMFASVLIPSNRIISFLKRIIKPAIACACILILFVVLGGWKTDIIQNMLFSLTGESASFIERGLIWSDAISLIVNNLFLGYGSYNASFAIGISGAMHSAHNTFLQIILYGGIIAFALYIFVFVKTVRNAACVVKSNYSFYLLMILFLYILLFSVEQYPFFVGYYFIVCLLPNIIKERGT